VTFIAKKEYTLKKLRSPSELYPLEASSFLHVKKKGDSFPDAFT